MIEGPTRVILISRFETRPPHAASKFERAKALGLKFDLEKVHLNATGIDVGSEERSVTYLSSHEPLT
jgi:hypothetical protein